MVVFAQIVTPTSSLLMHPQRPLNNSQDMLCLWLPCKSVQCGRTELKFLKRLVFVKSNGSISKGVSINTETRKKPCVFSQDDQNISTNHCQNCKHKAAVRAPMLWRFISNWKQLMYITLIVSFVPPGCIFLFSLNISIYIRCKYEILYICHTSICIFIMKV